MAVHNKITYNGITFVASYISDIASEPVYDEGGITVNYIKNTVSVSGVLQYAEQNSFITNANQIQGALLTPRAPLLITIGDQPWVNIPTVDVANGCFPRSCIIKDQLGLGFATIQYTIEYATKYCGNTQTTSLAILSNRFSVTHTLDKDFLTKREIKGKIVFNSKADFSINPDAYRNYVTPVLPSMMERTSVSYTVEADGVSLSYSIIDEEVYTTAPAPATTASGSSKVDFQLNPESGVTWLRSANITLTGAATTKKIDLYNAAYAVIDTILGLSNSDINSSLLKSFSLEEELFQNKISISASKKVFTGANLLPTNGNLHFFEQIKGSTNNLPDLSPYGSAMIGVANMMYYDPCKPDTSLNGVPKPVNTTSGTNSGPKLLIAQSPLGPLENPDNSNINPSQANNPISKYSAMYTFSETHHLLNMPSTKQGQPSFVFQYANPTVNFIWEGYLESYNSDADAPEPQLMPVFASGGAYVTKKTIQNYDPIISGNTTTPVFGVRWYIEGFLQYDANQFGVDSAGWSIINNVSISPQSQSLNVPLAPNPMLKGDGGDFIQMWNIAYGSDLLTGQNVPP